MDIFKRTAAEQPKAEQPVTARPDDFWSLMRALFAAGYPAGELPATLVAWSEAGNPDALAYLIAKLDEPSQVRRTLAAMYRRLAALGLGKPAGINQGNNSTELFPPNTEAWKKRLSDAEAADPESLTILRPYIDRDEAAMAEIDGYDKTYRGVRDEADRLVGEKIFGK